MKTTKPFSENSRRIPRDPSRMILELLFSNLIVNTMFSTHTLIRHLLTVMILFQWSSVANAQKDTREKKPEPDTGVEVVPISEWLPEIGRVSGLPGNEEYAPLAEEPVIIWTDRISLGVRYSRDFVTTNYLTLRVTVLNNGDEPRTIESGDVRFRGWNQTTRPIDQRQDSSVRTVRIDGKEQSVSSIKTPELITVEPKQAVSFWVAFVDFRRTPTLGQLQLELPVIAGKPMTVNLREQQRKRLGLQVNRIGAADVLTLLTIHGQLNSINVQDFVDTANALSENGAKRMLVRWSEDAPTMDDRILDWLLFAAANPGQVKGAYQEMVQLPPLDSLVCAAPPEGNHDAFTWDKSYRDVLFREVSDAARAALDSVYKVAEPKLVIREIRGGHPLSKSSALRSLQHRRDNQFDELFPLLKEMLKLEEGIQRKDTILAIGQQSHVEAISLLSQLATGEDTNDAEAALESLLLSDHLDSVNKLQSLMNSGEINVEMPKQLVLLTKHFRPEWIPALIDAVDSGDAKVRAEALRSLVNVGHPQLPKILQKALDDPDENVREVAFNALATRGDVHSESVALDYALKVLSEGKTSLQVLRLVERSRDLRTAPILVKLIKSEDEGREKLIKILASVGDESHIQALLEIQDDLNVTEKRALFPLVANLELPQTLEVGEQAVRDESGELMSIGVSILIREGSNQAADILSDALKSASDEHLEVLSLALGQIGTTHSLKLLKQFQRDMYEQKNSIGLKAAHTAMYAWNQYSPGWSSVQHAYFQSQREDYQKALEYFRLASEIDPELSIAFHGMGNALLKLEEFEKSKEAYQKALELDEFDGYAITGLAILWAIEGKTARAVELAENSIDKFPDDNVYYYNTACVYGRAVEFLEKQTQNKEIQSTIARYQIEGIQKLRESLELGFEEFELMRTDPDIASLRKLPEFAELPKN